MPRIAVDGVDGAGKTVLADELAQALNGLGRTVIRASVDDFHQPGPGAAAWAATLRRALTAILTTTQRS